MGIGKEVMERTSDAGTVAIGSVGRGLYKGGKAGLIVGALLFGALGVLSGGALGYLVGAFLFKGLIGAGVASAIGAGALGLLFGFEGATKGGLVGLTVGGFVGAIKAPFVGIKALATGRQNEHIQQNEQELQKMRAKAQAMAQQADLAEQQQRERATNIAAYGPNPNATTTNADRVMAGRSGAPNVGIPGTP